MRTYQIIEVKEHPTKFAAMVKFNDHTAEYYEVESLEPAVIAETLQNAANEAEVIQEQADEIVEAQNAIEVDEDGQIVI